VDLFACDNQTFNLNGLASNGTINWSTLGDGIITNGNQINPIYALGSTDLSNQSVDLIIEVTGTVSGVCLNSKKTDTVRVTIVSPPTDLILDQTYTFCDYDLPDSISLSGDFGYNVNWYLDNTLTTFVGTDKIALPSETTTFYLTQSIGGSCESNPVAVEIELSACLLDAPTAITPDGDNTNDTWIVPNLDEYYPDNVVRIYNRWGELLYESNVGQYNSNPWDGKVNNELLPVGSYYYFIDYNNGTGKTVNGVISIILNK
jgi:gliding motility-associated-like protein